MTSMNSPAVSLGAGPGEVFEVHVVYEPEAKRGDADFVDGFADVWGSRWGRPRCSGRRRAWRCPAL